MSVEGAAPSIVQASAKQYIFNRQQGYAVSASRENARGVGIATSAKRDEIVFRTASMVLDAQQAARLADPAGKQVGSLQKVELTIEERVKEGRELPVQSKRAALNVARARHVEQMAADQDAAERSLAVVLGGGVRLAGRFLYRPRMLTMEELRHLLIRDNVLHNGAPR